VGKPGGKRLLGRSMYSILWKQVQTAIERGSQPIYYLTELIKNGSHVPRYEFIKQLAYQLVTPNMQIRMERQQLRHKPQCTFYEQKYTVVSQIRLGYCPSNISWILKD
jgi:hypothetical protein